MLFNRSLKFRINKLIVSIVVLSSILILLAIWFATTRHAQTQLSRDLDVGQSVFVNSLQSRENLLINAATVLTDDFGFKQAVATEDAATISSMLNNHSERISADVMAVISLNGKTIGKSINLAQIQQPLVSDSMVETILNDGGMITFNHIDGRLYQSLFLTVDAPQPIAIAMVSFEMNQALINRFSQLTNLAITFIFSQDQKAFLTTLGDKDINLILANQLARDKQVDNVTNRHLASQSFRLTDYPQFDGYVVLTHDTDQLFKEFYVLLTDVVVISVIAIFCAIAFGVGFSKVLTKPLEHLSLLAKHISRGDYQSNIEINNSTTEIADLSTAFKQMQLNVSEREKTISYNAKHDMVTGLYNRKMLLDLLQEKLRAGQSFQAIAIQISGFRELNETFGYKVGDECLLYLANAVKGFGGIRARIAGGEVIWVPETKKDVDDLLTLQNELQRSILVSQVKVKINLVLGVVDSDGEFSEAEDVIRSLSIATSHARLTSNKIQMYLPEQEAAYIKRIEILYELQHLMENEDKHELSMFYQPKLSLLNNRVDKLEALIRWNSKKLGFVSPEVFIPIAESAGIIIELTQWVIRRVISDIASWKVENIQVAINLSAQDIVSEDIIRYINVCLIEFKVHPAQLAFEITESDIMSDPERAISQLNKFVELGFPLAIDDFGTGHSSLSYIKDFPVQTLKIDKAFILKLDQNKDDQSIVRCINSLARDFELKVVAEGVENEASLTMLRDLGCQYIQGYFISRPMPSADVKQWIEAFHQEKELQL